MSEPDHIPRPNFALQCALRSRGDASDGPEPERNASI
jgi:hypothetical protein